MLYEQWRWFTTTTTTIVNVGKTATEFYRHTLIMAHVMFYKRTQQKNVVLQKWKKKRKEERKEKRCRTRMFCVLWTWRAKSKLAFILLAWHYFHFVLFRSFSFLSLALLRCHIISSIILGSADPLYVMTGRGNEYIYNSLESWIPYTRSWAHIKQVDDLIKPVMRHPLLFFFSFFLFFLYVCVYVRLSAFRFKNEKKTKNSAGAMWLFALLNDRLSINILSQWLHISAFYFSLSIECYRYTHTIRRRTYPLLYAQTIYSNIFKNSNLFYSHDHCYVLRLIFQHDNFANVMNSTTKCELWTTTTTKKSGEFSMKTSDTK